MSQQRPFQHIQLRLIKDAPQKKSGPRVIEKKEQTRFFLNNRLAHANHLDSVGLSISEEWTQSRMQRQQDNLPDMPEALSLFLRIDPRELPIEELRKYGIEVIGELEDGFVIGASSELSLQTLRGKIKKFSEGEQHKLAGLWDIIDGVAWKREKILSETLYREWPIIKDHDLLVLEIGVACLGTEDVPEHPKKRRKNYKTEEAYEKALKKWETKRDMAYETWDNLSNSRYEQLHQIIQFYQGIDLSGLMQEDMDIEANLPDSFTVKIRISGKGFRDIVENYPYVFDIVEIDDIELIESSDNEGYSSDYDALQIATPEETAPAVCVIDSGIQERHIYLKDAIDGSISRSWVNSPTDVADYVDGGHGTRVAGAVLFPREIPMTGQVTPVCWIQNARVLEFNNAMPNSLFQPRLMREIVDHFLSSNRHTRIYNHSFNSTTPYRTVHMSAWAAAIDQLTWEKDVIFVVSCGNLYVNNHHKSIVRLTIADHLNNGREYPDYLLEPSSRIANPAQSLQAITVGSVGLAEMLSPLQSFSKFSEPSSYSCAGPGIFQSIKPEVVEFGGCYAHDGGAPRQIVSRPELSPRLISSTLHGGSALRQDRVGTSFAAPKVSHILASIQKEFPDESTMLYRALLVQSARWPEWTINHPRPDNVIRHIGYGVPDVSRATENSPYRITLITQGEVRVSGKQVHIYEVRIPEELSSQGEQFDIRIDVTLSYKAQPRRTRRNRQRYLSTWLEWDTSKKHESIEHFLNRMVDLASDDTLNSTDIPEESRDAIKWMIHKQNNWGKVKGFKRDENTVQKDWAHIKSYEWGSGFYIAVIGHIGWNRDMDATVPYALAVSFEAVNQDVEIYQRIAIENEVAVEVQVNMKSPMND